MREESEECKESEGREESEDSASECQAQAPHGWNCGTPRDQRGSAALAEGRL